MRLLRTLGLRMLRLLLLFALVASALLLLFQHRLIYFPRKYQPFELANLPARARPLEYRTSQGRQVCFYFPPAQPAAEQPHRLWLLFMGNASLALDWSDFVRDAPDPHAAYLLIDYPGYGECEGSASPKAIDESSTAAFHTLLEKAPLARDKLQLGLIGLSIGSAAALQFANHEPIDRVILIAPFASVLEEARRAVGVPLCYLLRHRFDNRQILARLAARPHPPSVRIFHGSADTVIPPIRSRQLAEEFPAMISRTEIPGADHDTVLFTATPQIYAAMRE